MTKAQAIADLELRLSGGKPSDDLSLWYPQLRAWLEQAVEAQLQSEVGRDVDAIQDIPGQAVKEYDCLAVATRAADAWCGPCDRHYVPLPTFTNDLGETESVRIPRLPRNMGVVSVWIGTAKIERATTRSEMIRFLDFGGGEFWYLLGDRVYIYGGHYPTKTKVSLHLLVTSLEALDDGDELPCTNPMEAIAAAEEIGRRQLGLPQDITNDGQAATESL